MRSLVFIAAVFTSCGAAFASGDLLCTADDGKVGFEVFAGVTHGMGAPVFSLRGELHVQPVAAGLRDWTFERPHLAQYWLNGDQLNLVLYRDRDAGPGFVELTIATKARGGDDEGYYDGTYTLVGPVDDDGLPDFSGKVECSAE